MRSFWVSHCTQGCDVGSKNARHHAVGGLSEWFKARPICASRTNQSATATNINQPTSTSGTFNPPYAIRFVNAFNTVSILLVNQSQGSPCARERYWSCCWLGWPWQRSPGVHSAGSAFIWEHSWSILGQMGNLICVNAGLQPQTTKHRAVRN